MGRMIKLLLGEPGASLVEFAIVVPLLVVFVVGIYDFSAAFNQRQKIEQAAQESAIVAGAQPMGDISAAAGPPTNPDSLQPVLTAAVNSLAGSGILTNANQGTCKAPFAPPAQAALTWTYTIAGCSSAHPSDNLIISINRGLVVCPPPCAAGATSTVATMVNVKYPYHWRFGGVIQLLFPGPNGYLTPTQVTDSATVHNQM